MAKKKAINFGSQKKKNNWVKADHSIPSKTNPGKSVAQASPGNTPLKVRGKSVKVNHTKSNIIKNSAALDKAKETKRPPHRTSSAKKKKKK